MPIRAFRISALVASVMTLTVMGVGSCGGAGKRSARVVGSKMISRTGGSVDGADGAKVLVPAEALIHDVTVVVSALAGVRVPAGAAVVGQAMRLEPAGTSFEKPVTISIPIAPADLNGRPIGNVVIIRSEQDSNVFVPLPTRRSPDGKAVVAVTEHFSDFVAVFVEDTAEPFGTCGNDVCESDESCDACPYDCGVCIGTNECGNGTCESSTNGESCQTCYYDCGECAPGVCGNGYVDGGEFCDDGNQLDGDGCTAGCEYVEYPYTCAATGGSCWICADGILQVGESCDEGAESDGIGCYYDCSGIEPNYSCANVGSACVYQVFCGNGTVDATETCDDGNATPADGCDNFCNVEVGYACPIPNQACYLGACGDSMVDAPEACDDGNTVDFDGCSYACTTIDIGWACPTPGQACYMP